MKDHLRIFVPIDFKARSINAIKRAIELCEVIDAKLFIGHIYNRPYFILDPELGYDEDALLRIENFTSRRMAEQVDENFAELKKQIPGLEKVRYEFVKEIGNVIHAIVNAVDNYKIDLIIMGTSGLSGFSEIFGNKTSEVVDQVKCSVMIVHEEVQKLNLDKIALACDFSGREDFSSLELLKKLVNASMADVDIVHVVKHPEKVKAEVEREAIKWKWHIKSKKKSVQFCCHSNVEKGLLQYVNEHQVGILALLPHHRNFLDSLINENVTHKMAFHAKVPVLALH